MLFFLVCSLKRRINTHTHTHTDIPRRQIVRFANIIGQPVEYYFSRITSYIYIHIRIIYIIRIYRHINLYYKTCSTEHPLTLALALLALWLCGSVRSIPLFVVRYIIHTCIMVYAK